MALFFQFVDPETNAPVELEEFIISLFDFDQTWADGARGYIRESIVVADFTTLFVQHSAHVELFFSNETLKLDSVTSVDPVTSEPESYGIVDKNAVLVRSTTHGTSSARDPKSSWELCQGACDQTPVCNTKRVRRDSDVNDPMYWTGCGYSDAAADTANTNATYYDSGGNSVTCIQDCPRTSVSYDDVLPPLTSNSLSSNIPQADWQKTPIATLTCAGQSDGPEFSDIPAARALRLFHVPFRKPTETRKRTPPTVTTLH